MDVRDFAGIGSGREIERRQSSDPAFRWIVGDQRVGRTSLLVRGLDKVTCLALLTALTMNLVAHAALLV